jgi:hypothetical protein
MQLRFGERKLAVLSQERWKMIRHVPREQVQDQVQEQARRLDLFVQLLDRMLRDVMIVDHGSVRQTLLLASLLRVSQAARAVQLLASENCVEEILTIGRTLIEVTVNAAYLYQASEGELQRYLEFHPESLYRRRDNLARERGGKLTTSILQKLGDLVLAGSSLTRRDADPTWTQRTLLERAHLSDMASQMPIMAPLVQRCFAQSHGAVHGTMGGIDSFVAAVETGGMPGRQDRSEDMVEALFAVNLCLLTVSIYLNGMFDLEMDEAIDEAARVTSPSQASRPGR